MNGNPEINSELENFKQNLEKKYKQFQKELESIQINLNNIK